MPAAKPKRPMPERRTRFEPPTLEEAIFAAQGLTDAPEELAEIAAQLTGLPEAEVKPEVLKAVAAARRPQSVRFTASGATVVVERRRVRVAMPAR
jgi:hypothetical protein